MMRAIVGILSCVMAASSALADPPHYAPPAETARLSDGPGDATARAHCVTCHSADYITTQPRTFADPLAFWSAEVAKMKKAYGAPIADADSQTIVAYLVANYGRGGDPGPKS
jgi:cytochrome c553